MLPILAYPMCFHNSLGHCASYPSKRMWFLGSIFMSCLLRLKCFYFIFHPCRKKDLIYVRPICRKFPCAHSIADLFQCGKHAFVCVR